MKRISLLVVLFVFVHQAVLAQSGALVFLHPEYFLRKHLTNYEAPQYPDEARNEKAHGTVHLFVVFDTQGRLSEATILDSPNESLAEAVLSACKTWRLKPYAQDAEAFYLGELRVVFTLEEGSAKVTETSEADQRKVSDRFTKEKTDWIKRNKGQG